ncbi:MAG: response regulator [Alphaproteobacteria bacterium]|nr:response regulator [Alphaproteobacteria bacterium]
MGKVFIVDDKKERADFYAKLLEKKGIEVFATNNVYKMTKYSKELSPDLYVVDAEVKDPDYKMLIGYLVKNFKTPLAVICKNIEEAWHAGVSHYVLRSMVNEKLGEVAGAYCQGGKKYDFLLFEPKKQEDYLLKEKQSFLRIHDMRAAKVFLEKNAVRAIGLCCNRDKYLELSKKFAMAKTFYVEKITKDGDLKAILK